MLSGWCHSQMNIFIITKLPQKIVVKESLRRGFGVLENSSLPSTSFNGPYLAQNDAIAIIAIFGSIILMSIFACIFICCHKQSRANVSESHDKKKNITITLSQPAGHQFEPVNNTILDDEDGGGWHGKRRSESFQLRGSSEDKANRRHGFKAYKNLNSPDFGVEIPGSDSNLSSCQQSHAANSPDKIGKNILSSALKLCSITDSYYCCYCTHRRLVCQRHRSDSKRWRIFSQFQHIFQHRHGDWGWLNPFTTNSSNI